MSHIAFGGSTATQLLVSSSPSSSSGSAAPPVAVTSISAGGGAPGRPTSTPGASSASSASSAGSVSGGGVPLASTPPAVSVLTSVSGRCCEGGRPLFTDPLTGQSVCSCQYDPHAHLLSYQRLASGAIPLAVYGGAYSEQMAAYMPASAALGPEQAAFYSQAAGGLDLKDNLGGAAGAPGWPYTSMYHPYDTAALAGYPFNGYGMDLNGARRKNATRETTSTLKAWLNEHKKNPYPTKGEKIMLAIITKMTLTQVSTWFANARRRLKKENKMTWEPRNRVDEDDGVDEGQKKMDGESLRDTARPSSPGSLREDSDDDRHDASSPDVGREDGPPLVGRGMSGLSSRLSSGPEASSPGSSVGSPGPGPIQSKPRIWSLADMANKGNSAGRDVTISATDGATSAFLATAASRAVHPAAFTRMGMGLSEASVTSSPFIRPPPDAYFRSAYGSALCRGPLGSPGDALMSPFSRTFTLNGLSSAASPLSVLANKSGHTGAMALNGNLEFAALAASASSDHHPSLSRIPSTSSDTLSKSSYG